VACAAGVAISEALEATEDALGRARKAMDVFAVLFALG
jgi:hypothetical protein